MIVVLAPGIKVPLVTDMSIHDCVLDAVQSRDELPVLVRVYAMLEGMKGPPCIPDETKISVART